MSGVGGEMATRQTHKRPEKIRLGVSACLLGERVRYDGGHRHDRYLTDTLGQDVEWVPVCPEVECGLSVPREAMHLEGDPASPHLVTETGGIDYTARMSRWIRRRLRDLASEGLQGFVLKSKSPSCGLREVPVRDASARPGRCGMGLFARAIVERWPTMPVEEAERLSNPERRKKFLERVFGQSGA